ncbi:GNAT superfamily N-acetyltransferase [Agrobacterium sp. SORGH_AS440]|nr:GNAT superfamily N-acetyltransferase [Agrobacterium sp. SORGH_AS_0440]
MAALLNSVRAFFTPQTFHVDQENPGDVVARENLLDRAMGAGRRRKSSEKLRAGRVPAEGLALVARDEDGHVIGTVRLWNVEAGISREGRAVEALLLGPLAVDAAHEGKGIGSALMPRRHYRGHQAGPWRHSSGWRRTLLRAFRLFRRQGPASHHARPVRAQPFSGAGAESWLA